MPSDLESAQAFTNADSAIDYAIVAHGLRKAQSLLDPNNSFIGSVMSLSLESTSTVAAITAAISAASSAGLHIVVAAGNSADNACSNSPASSGGNQGPAITVGSINLDATVSSFSNTGPCVDVYAPGENVLSAWNTGPTVLKALSGTSMSTPHVTGIVAYAMAGNATLAGNTTLMKQWVAQTALKGVVNGPAIDGDQGLLANNGQTAAAVVDVDGILGFTKGTGV